MPIFSFQAFTPDTDVVRIATTPFGKILVANSRGETATWILSDSTQKPKIRRHSNAKSLPVEHNLYLGYTEEALPVMLWLTADHKVRCHYLTTDPEAIYEEIVIAAPAGSSPTTVRSINDVVTAIAFQARSAAGEKLYFYNVNYKTCKPADNLRDIRFIHDAENSVLALEDKSTLIYGSFNHDVFGAIKTKFTYKIDDKDYRQTSEHDIENFYLSLNDNFVLVLEKNPHVMALYYIDKTHSTLSLFASTYVDKLKLSPGVTINHYAVYDSSESSVVISAVCSDGTIFLWAIQKLPNGKIMQNRELLDSTNKKALNYCTFIPSEDGGKYDILVVAGAQGWVHYINWCEYLALYNTSPPRPVKRRRLERSVTGPIAK